ncbi:uncharacterized protein LOC128034561 [Gossypium raimondii]|uniref:uncharacterized protein LOC128034561 n=1 Tax=Gossypium raimondii TaxID=29730 RepID=UPI00227A46B0|nr:uncharacterized protein LOC128034561 [Gossypium raimondii]
MRNVAEKDVPFSKDSILHSSWNWVKALKCTVGRLEDCTRRQTRCSRWIPPPTDTIKLNTDGARDPILGLAASAAVARDEFDIWVRGVGRNIGRCGVEQAKLWAIYDRLIMAWDAQWRHIFMETYCALAFKGTTDKLRGCVQRILVLRIQELESRYWNVVFKQIPREINSVAHSLAGMMKEV